MSGVASVTVDGVERHDKVVRLVDDRGEHRVRVAVYESPKGAD
jgi:hypothetical protein